MFSLLHLSSMVAVKGLQKSFNLFNPSRLDPGERGSINLKFCFYASLRCLKSFHEGRKGLHKTF